MLDDAWNHAIFSEVLRFSFNQEFKTITDFNFQNQLQIKLTDFHPKPLLKNFYKNYLLY